MKKAKIMLSAITVLAIVGGALAFTAKSNPTTIYTIQGANGTCTTSELVKTKPSGPNTIMASTSDGGTCTTFTIDGN